MTLRTKLLWTLGVIVLVPVIAVGTLLVASGYNDPPSPMFGGGPLVEGELFTGPEPDWSFVHDLPTIEMQLLEPPRSRIIWVLDHAGKAYIVSGYMGSAMGRVWKHWPLQAERDGRAVVRIAGKRYERMLKRITSGPQVEGIAAELRRKYRYEVTPADIAAGTTWLFELAPRSTPTAGGAN